MQEMEQGRYDNLPSEQYRNECYGWSKSSLDKATRSIAHYLYSKENPEQTESLTFGAAFHCAILEPEKFESEYVVAPECDRRTTIGKKIWADFVFENSGKSIIKAAEMESITAMREMIAAHPVASELLKCGSPEVSYFWKDQGTGLNCKCRADFVCNDNWNTVVDLKTTDNASIEEFQRSVGKYRYHVQAAYYLDGISLVEEKKHTNFLIIAVEKNPPYCVAVYDMIQTLDAGRAAYERDLETVESYVKANGDCWIGYPQNIQTIKLPAYLQAIKKL
jgi:hypothetical protein